MGDAGVFALAGVSARARWRATSSKQRFMVIRDEADPLPDPQTNTVPQRVLAEQSTNIQPQKKRGHSSVDSVPAQHRRKTAQQMEKQRDLTSSQRRNRTLHSLLRLPVRSGFAPVNPDSLQQLQKQMRHCEVLIIDEKSMIGLQTLHHVDQRLRQIKSQPDTPFDGMHIVLFGDFAQLPPVGESAMYMPHGQFPDKPCNIAGKDAYSMFTSTITLSMIMRQRGTSAGDERFRQVLEEFRSGPITRESWGFLTTRTRDRLSFEEWRSFHAAVRLYPTKKMVRGFNLQRLADLRQPILKIEAVNHGTGAKETDADNAGRLENELLLCRGARVMLTYNLSVSEGLVNGTMGTVFTFLWANSDDDPLRTMPTMILVEFDGYTGRAAVDIGDKLYVPLRPRAQQFEIDEHACERKQFPLMLAAAMTIHKSQGMTLDRVVLDLAGRDFSVGLLCCSLPRTTNH